MTTLTSRYQFVGFSTVHTKRNKVLVDIAIVNQDLLNQFNTKPNERVMMPGWGFAGWNYLFEPFDNTVQAAIVNSAQQVIDSDPRVQLQNMQVTTFENGIRIFMSLLYVPWQAIGNFEVNFDTRSQSL